MKVLKNEKWKGGWFIGNFEPSSFKSNDFEVCFKQHPKGENWPAHYHKIATEINYLIRGKMTIKNELLQSGDVFIIQPLEIADPEFLEDCEIIVVKTPCVKNDKYEVI